MSVPDRRAKLDRDHAVLSIRRQCALLGLARSGVYRRRRAANDNDLDVMRRIDELFLRWPFLGSRRLMAGARGRGAAGQPQASATADAADWDCGARAEAADQQAVGGHRIYPYLLRDLVIDRPNRVWCADITYLPMGRGFLYLVAIMDWHSRAVLVWRVSNRMDTGFCISALEEALSRFGKPEIFNTDQGSQFTSTAFTDVLTAAGIRISMDGKGRWMDNVFIERLWRSLKYEDLYIKGYADGAELRAGLGQWFDFYNHQRPHMALDNRAPMAVWREAMVGVLPPTAVDMTLLLRRSLDNAAALPTSPQPQQQQVA